MNTFLLEASRWLWDYFLLATVLLAVVLVLGKLLTQPARRMAVHWSVATGLLLLALLCAVPDWSMLHMLPSSPEPPPAWMENLEPIAGPAIQATNIAPQPVPKLPQIVPNTSNTTTISVATKITVLDYGVLSFYAIAAGSLVVLFWLTLGTWQVRRLRRQAQQASPELVELLAKISKDKPPALGIVAKLPVAAAVGLLSPMILLPQKFLEHSNSDKLQTVLAHDLAHIRHRDLWLLTLLRCLLFMLWAHPLYWLWRRRVRLDQETLADVAAARMTSRTDYAEQLVAMARETASVSRRLPLASSVGLWEGPSQLKQRVAVLLDEKLTVLRSCSRRWGVGSALGMLAIAGGLSLITLRPAEPQTALVESNETANPDETLAAEEKKPESESFNWHYASPPSDSDDNTNRAVSKPSTSSAIPSNSIIQARQQFLKRLPEMGMGKPNNIFGICMDEKGQPLAGVSIQVYVQQASRPEENSRSILETISDAKGEFVFKNVVNVAKEFPEGLPEEYFQGPEANTLTLQGRVKGRVTYISFESPADIVRGSSAHVCVMPPAKVLRGRVMNKEGQPVTGAEIAVGLDAIRRNGLGGNSTTTNTNGEYVIDGLPSEDLVGSNQALFVKHPKYAVRRARMVKIPDKLDMQLVPGSVIEGAVQLPEDETNAKPFPGSLVHLQRVLRPDEQIDHFGYQVEKTAIDKNGHFRFESLPAGKYRLTADVEGWVTQGIENVEVAQEETATAPDILLARGERVRVQLLDDKTGEPMRFEEPTKGYLHPRQQPQRAGIFTSKNNSIVEFSTEGICEIQLLAGQYSFLVSIPLTDSSSRISVLRDDPDERPTYEVVDGERLEIAVRLRVQKRPAVADGTFTVTIAASPASDEDSKEETPEGTFDVPATPAAENTDQDKNLNSIFDERTNQKGGSVK